MNLHVSKTRLLFGVLFICCYLYPFALNAQDQPATVIETQQEGLLVFIDCTDYWCDLDYIRTEITYVNYVRDRKDAHVHILITTQGTGGGGTEFTLAFIGLEQFEGNDNTLKYISRQTDTEDDVRKGLVRILKIGLMEYVAHTAVIENIEVTYTNPDTGEEKTQKVKDPWNYWTFRMSLNGSGSGEKSYKSNRISSSFSTSRTTEEWKLRFSVHGSYNESKFDYGDELSYTDVRRNYDFSGLVVKSLGNHWSFGSRGFAEKSTYGNIDYAFGLAPGIEYNVFPYSESTRRELTLRYAISTSYTDYQEITIFEKTREMLFNHSLDVSYDVKEPWGSISASIDATNYLHDMYLYRLSLFSSLEVRIFKGFSFHMFGFLSFLRGQLSLPLREADPEEVLLRRRMLETSYDYYFSFGFSYTFGSIYNNVVNPRYGGSGGGSVFYF